MRVTITNDSGEVLADLNVVSMAEDTTFNVSDDAIRNGTDVDRGDIAEAFEEAFADEIRTAIRHVAGHVFPPREEPCRDCAARGPSGLGRCPRCAAKIAKPTERCPEPALFRSGVHGSDCRCRGTGRVPA